MWQIENIHEFWAIMWQIAWFNSTLHVVNAMRKVPPYSLQNIKVYYVQKISEIYHHTDSLIKLKSVDTRLEFVDLYTNHHLCSFDIADGDSILQDVNRCWISFKVLNSQFLRCGWLWIQVEDKEIKIRIVIKIQKQNVILQLRIF